MVSLAWYPMLVGHSGNCQSGPHFKTVLLKPSIDPLNIFKRCLKFRVYVGVKSQVKQQYAIFEKRDCSMKIAN